MLFKTSTYKLAAAACLALGTVAFAEPVTGDAPAQPTPNASDRASGRANNTANDASTRQPEGTVVDNNRDLTRDAASENSLNQQLAAIAKNPDQAGDKLFVLDAGLGNLWEIEYSRVVAERASNEKVKAAAQHIIKDHTAAQAKLAEAAQAVGVTLPNSLPAMKQQKLAIFRSMPVDKLENGYISNGRADHAKDVICYSDQARSAENPKVKAYAAETLPALRQHAQHLDEAAAAKGLPAAANTARTE